MSSRIKVILPWAVLALLVLVKMAGHFADGLSYSLRSQQPSPDKSRTIFEFRSDSDGAGHAPYGTSLSLSAKRSINSADEGYAFFAGYCKKPVAYSWQGNSKIVVRCQAADKDSVRTQAVRAYAIDIEVEVKAD